MDCKCYVAETIEKLDTLLSKINTDSLSNMELATTFRQVMAIQSELKKLQQKHEEMLYEQGRHYAENVKLFSIHAPPDKPNLQTVPWELGKPSTTIPPKGALTRRTMDAIPTVQKKK